MVSLKMSDSSVRNASRSLVHDSLVERRGPMFGIVMMFVVCANGFWMVTVLCCPDVIEVGVGITFVHSAVHLSTYLRSLVA